MSNLRTFRDWCTANGDDTSLTADERGLWRYLAHVIDIYLQEQK